MTTVSRTEEIPLLYYLFLKFGPKNVFTALSEEDICNIMHIQSYDMLYKH
jgi:hypothetical protein